MRMEISIRQIKIKNHRLQPIKKYTNYHLSVFLVLIFTTLNIPL